ncbi:MAG: GNAT family N-acetyltransferase [Marinibacterium sp.]|nr:GNAT family N-acetyltransferase [Marinibacterium sp.]
MLRTDRLLLRPARDDDLDAIHAVMSSPAAMRYWSHPAHDDIAQTRRFLDGMVHPDPARQYEFVVDLDGQCIGKAGVFRLPSDDSGPDGGGLKPPEVGYFLHPDHWGKGLAVEAVRAILPGGFAAFPDHDHLIAEIDPRNHGSRRVLEKLGFTCTQVIEKNFLYGADEWCDTAYFRLDRPA